jgi:hypothetical protein
MGDYGEASWRKQANVLLTLCRVPTLHSATLRTRKLNPSSKCQYLTRDVR